MTDPSVEPPPSDTLLRTLAAVPVSSTILDLGCGRGRHTEPLLRLGFPVHACDPRPGAVEATRARVGDLLEADTAETCVRTTSLHELESIDETFNWIVADRAEIYASTEQELTALLTAGRRLLSPGGWMHVTVPAANDEEGGGGPPSFTDAALDHSRQKAGLDEAREVERVDASDGLRLRALYRRVEPETPV